MYFSKYYDSERFMANKMNTRAAISLTNSEYQPPPDIQFFYLLEIIEDMSALGQTQIKIFNFVINEEVINKLKELGYYTYRNNEDLSLIIEWRNT